MLEVSLVISMLLVGFLGLRNGVSDEQLLIEGGVFVFFIRVAFVVFVQEVARIQAGGDGEGCGTMLPDSQGLLDKQ